MQWEGICLVNLEIINQTGKLWLLDTIISTCDYSTVYVILFTGWEWGWVGVFLFHNNHRYAVMQSWLVFFFLVVKDDITYLQLIICNNSLLWKMLDYSVSETEVVSFWFAVSHCTDSAVATAVEKMIMVYNQELFWCNGVPTKHDKALKWIQSLRGHILLTNKPASLAASLPMAISHLHVSCAHSPVGLLLT